MTSFAVPRDALPSQRRELPRLVVVLLVLLVVIALLPCEHVVARYLRVPFFGSGRSLNHFVLTEAVVLRALVAGVLVDAFGVRRVMALALIVWCVLTAASSFVHDPRGLALLDLNTTLALGVYGIVGWVVIGSRLSRDRALPLAIVFIASYSSVLAVPFLTTTVVRSIRIDDPEGARQYAAFFLASIGAFITFVWLIFCPASVNDSAVWLARRGVASACNGLVRLLGNRRLWPILLLFVLAGFVFEIGYYRIDRFLAGERGISSYSPYIAGIAGSLIGAAASDRQLGSTGSLEIARRPFIVAAFLLSIGVALLPILPQEDLVAMTCIIGFGLGLQVVLGALVLDIVPLRHLGAFVGLLVAINDFVRLALYEVVVAIWPHTHSYAPILVGGGLAAIAGAILAARSLRGLAPVEITAA